MREMQDNGDLLTPEGVKYTEAYWQVAPNQALKITFTPPADIPYAAGRYSLLEFCTDEYADGKLRLAFGDSGQ